MPKRISKRPSDENQAAFLMVERFHGTGSTVQSPSYEQSKMR